AWPMRSTGPPKASKQPISSDQIFRPWKYRWHGVTANRIPIMDNITLNGLTFSVSLEYDYVHRAPWEECDGHGPVSDWTSRDKLPGERVLRHDRGSYRYYDVAEATRIAKRDGW